MTAAAAPQVLARETRKPEFPATVHAYTDALQLLRDTPGLTADQISDQTDRLKWNVNRDLHKLVDAGVIEGKGGDHGDKAWSLTAKGTRWVEGIDVASGRAQAGGEMTALLVQLIPDPDQPRKTFDETELGDLIHSIHTKGLLQPILVRPAGANRLHIIIAGERRYRAIKALATDGLWAADKPVPIRIASPEDEAEVMELALVENTQRTDLNHMELALGYQRLADLGRSPKQIAAVVGRTNDHVTQHLRLTRLEAEDQAAVAAGTLPLHQALEKLRAPKGEAEPVADTPAGRSAEWTTHDVHKTPFGARDGDTEPLMTIHILHDGDGSFRSLSRPSLPLGAPAFESLSYRAEGAALHAAIHYLRGICVAEDPPRPAIEWLDTLQGPHVVNGVDGFNAARAQERRFALGWDERKANHSAQAASDRVASDSGRETDPDEPPLPFDAAEPKSYPDLSPRARLALIELAHKVGDERRPWGDEEGGRVGASVGSYWLDTAHSELTAAGLATFAQVRGGLPPIAALTHKGSAWLDSQGFELPVTEAAKEKAQIASGLEIHDWPYVTPWLAQVAQPAEAPIDSAQAASDRVASDSAQTDEADATAAALDETILALVAADAEILTGNPAKVFSDLGISDVRASASNAGLIIFSGPDNQPVTHLTVDVDGELPDSRAEALAGLIAHQLRQVLA